ncbi:MAG TPA: serine hydrolase domain-containing protein [Vitreimonas sp.]|nr:serine hydrolase domain-containing protein [Vitreimonas sp.]
MVRATEGLAERVTAGLDAIDFSGVVVVDGTDGPIVRLARGLADRATGRPTGMATRFGVASASKLFTTVAALRQAARGELGLDVPLVDLLPPASRPTQLDARVTTRHLLTHTSGMTDYFDEYAGDDYAVIWRRVPAGRMRAPADMLELFRHLPPRAAPGEEVRYSNAGFVLLGIVVETVGRAAFPDVVAREVFEPAAMAGSGYPATDDVVLDLAIGYLPPTEPGGSWRSNAHAIPVVGGGDGGAISAADDLVAFLRALRDGRLLDEPLLRAALTPATQREDELWSYGLGFQVAGEGEQRWVGHTGEDPGYSARLRWYPSLDLRMVVLSNVTNGAAPARAAVEAALFD